MLCLCGYKVRGEIEVELIANVRNHIDEAHPENRTVSDEEILASFERQQCLFEGDPDRKEGC